MRSEAEPACLGTATPHLSDPRFCERPFVEFGGAAGREFQREGSASRTRRIAPEPPRGGRECFRGFRVEGVGEDVPLGNASRHLNGSRVLSGGSGFVAEGG